MDLRADQDLATPDQAALPMDERQVGWMNRTIKYATVNRYHYGSYDELRQHLQLFVEAYNYGRRLETMRGLTPYEFVCQAWTKQLERFRLDTSHHTAAPNI